MPARSHIRHAARILARGGVALYPTEGVWGLGCDPLNVQAVSRILALKQRAPDKGLIIVAGDVAWLRPYLADAHTVDALAQAPSGTPTTFVVPAAGWVPAWLTGGRDTLAVRITQHPVAAALSSALAAPIVSTSANLAGRPATARRFGIAPSIWHGVDLRLGGQTGGLKGATPIIDLRSGQRLRGS